jgi:adenine-specific DNA methylase
MGHKPGLENRFDIAFTAALAQREKQIQQNYRPIIGVHKWFARRPGTVFRNLLLAEFNGNEPASDSFWHTHSFSGIIADPFMGGGTTAYEANRLGFSFVGADVNPMAYWVVRQSLSPLNRASFKSEANAAIDAVEKQVGQLYRTKCLSCSQSAPVKYFIWVKNQSCPNCSASNDLFPGYLLAEAERHPRHVVACSKCHALNEYEEVPTKVEPRRCRSCKHLVFVDGPAQRGKIDCHACGITFNYPVPGPARSPQHRLWAIEYHCAVCRTDRSARMFKKPDKDDLARVREAEVQLASTRARLPIPNDEIPNGDETKRLHRWGYRHFSDMFNERQLLGLGLLLKRLMAVQDVSVRHALVTVFSDFLRYQNMLCRYDTYALKCQDIFSVHGFPVGLVQCENSLLGIPKVGSGSFRHFVEKYLRAKEYCAQPFETMIDSIGRKKVVAIQGERIEASLVTEFPCAERQAWLSSSPATMVKLPPNSLDGVFTDPPYYDNVQYAELMDFCYAWLRMALGNEVQCFEATTTKTHAELTGNTTLQRGLDSFTAGLSAVFTHFSSALKENAPFVFTYHHNDPEAYVPLVVSILDAGMDCSATLPVPAEMAASLHIAGANSSVLDSVFVCRRIRSDKKPLTVMDALEGDVRSLERGGMKLRSGDIRCLKAGHIARLAVNALQNSWTPSLPLSTRMRLARETIAQIGDRESSKATAIIKEIEQGGEMSRRRAATV